MAMPRVSAMSIPQVVAEETVETTPSTSTSIRGSINDDDKPPVITRYDKSTYPVSTPTPPTVVSGPQRILYTQRTGPPQSNGKVLLIRRNDGTTQYLRPVPAKKPEGVTRSLTLASSDLQTSGQPVRRIVASVGNRPNAVVRTVAAPTRILRVGPDGQQIMSAVPSGPKILSTRVLAAENGASTSVNSKRVPSYSPFQTARTVHRALPQKYEDVYQRDYATKTVNPSIHQGHSYGRPVSRIITRGGATMAMGQRIAQQPSLGTVRTIKPSGNFTFKRGSHEYVRMPSYNSRPYRFDFESNEDEERAIAEAIAREEEIMRKEEEEKREQERQWNYPRIIDKFGQVGSAMLHQLSKQPLQFSSNLMPARDDSPDTKQIKQTLDGIITQVCRWDKQYGWFKAHQKKPKSRFDFDKLRTRRMFSNQRELMLAEHVDRLRKEINKRRTKLELEAERLCGLPAPWRKGKSKSSKAKKSTAKKSGAANNTPIPENPAEISLGGDAIDWAKKEAKEEDELVEETEHSPKKVKIEIEEESKGPLSRKRPSLNKSDRVLRQRINSHSSVEETSGRNEPPKKRGRPRKDLVTTDPSHKSDDSDGDGTDHGIPEGMENPNDPHCICKKPYNSRRFYISCDICSGWFHGKCVGIRPEACTTLSSWMCPQCAEEKEKAEQNQPLYCICQKPYDDTLFYVGCDTCEDWFHPECVGITQEYALKIEEYMCPKCKTQFEKEKTDGYESTASEASIGSTSPALSRADYQKVWRLLETISEHRMSWPFKEPIDPTKYPGYTDVVQRPMDLSTIHTKLERLEYIKLRDFTHDVILMFENAKAFNPKESPIYLCATTLEKIYEQNLVELKNEIASRYAIDRRKPSESSESHTVDSSLDIDTDQLIEPDVDAGNFDINQYIGI